MDEKHDFENDLAGDDELSDLSIVENEPSEALIRDLKENIQGELREIIKKYLIIFFADQEMYYGGLIPTEVLFSPLYVSTVANFDISKATDNAYSVLQHVDDIYDQDPDADDDGSVSGDVRLMTTLLRECASLDIPKTFAPGISLIFLELCKGVNIVSLQSILKLQERYRTPEERQRQILNFWQLIAA